MTVLLNAKIMSSDVLFYFEKHLPKFLKRLRNGKSRLISKDVFVNLLNNCTSRKDKICLHQTCEYLFWFLRNNLSHQRTSLASEHMLEIQDKVSKNLNASIGMN
jgi:hypothetical protein